jgi:DNA-binding transcriptional LysR family regulator
MIDWSDLRFILAVARHRTLTAAARSLGCDQSTVTRRLAAFQSALGTRLIDRRGGSYVLTAAGERLRPRLEAVEAEALAFERAAQGHDEVPRGAVRLTTVETLASRLLAPRLAALRERSPDIALEIDVDRRDFDLARREADVALRVARPRQAQLVAKKVGAIGLALYASDGYLAKRGAPRLGERSVDHEVVADVDERAWTPGERLLSACVPGARVSFRTTSWLTRVAAVEAGAGISALPCFVADASPSLRRLGSDPVLRDLWLIVHRDLQRVARVRAVLDFVADIIEENRSMLAGDAPAHGDPAHLAPPRGPPGRARRPASARG